MTFTICNKRQSVLDASSHCLVMGGPGSGKTTLALLKAAAAFKQGLLAGQEILFLSFSRAAVGRISEAASKEQSLSAMGAAVSIQTFHSFFWQIIKAHGYLLGAPRTLSILLSHDERALSDGIERNHAGWNSWDTSRRRLFHDEGRICFDLFAPLAGDLLRRAARIRDRVATRYPVILVDEAQDTSNDQWECVRLLAVKSQVICLADPNQMIYDFLPGVGAGRIEEIRAALHPHEIDLESENNRSPNTEIAIFSRDVLLGKVRPGGYKGISRLSYSPDSAGRDKAIRSSVGLLYKRIVEQTKQKPENIGMLASYGRGVAIISSALQQDRPIEHQVLFDEAFALLSSRIVAFLLEPKEALQHSADTATVLELTAMAYRAKGTQAGTDVASKCLAYATKCRQGAIPKFKVAAAAGALVMASRTRRLSGNPRADWSTIRLDLRQSADQIFKSMASALEYLVAFRRGHRISENLTAIWLEHGSYLGARDAVNDALTQDQLLSASEQSDGINVMNMHKCKGKQFDGVVLYRQQHHSPFVWRDESAPYAASRRLLHMAIARARLHVLVLDEASSACPIMDPYNL